MHNRQLLSTIVDLTNAEQVPAERVIEFFRKAFTDIDEKFFEVFDLNVVPFKKVSLQSYYLHDDFSRCVGLDCPVHYKGIDQGTFVAFAKRHGIYFEFTPSQMYLFCREHFSKFQSWGGYNCFLVKGKDRLYWVTFGINYCDDDWPRMIDEDRFTIRVKPYHQSDFQGYEYPFLLATPTLFAKNILVSKITTYI